jgi:hypothetical protein
MYTSSDSSHRWLPRPQRRRQSTVGFIIQTVGLIALFVMLIGISRML